MLPHSKINSTNIDSYSLDSKKLKASIWWTMVTVVGGLRKMRSVQRAENAALGRKDTG